MFANVLIANRGEIACRIIATARRMGLRTLALATPADRGALFTRLADETHEIGVGAEGYLDADAIIALARRVGAQALHPGYGFLSENADFAEACGRAGIVFVGPSPAAMRAMGLKSSAKALMAKAGAPIVPGYHGDNQSAKFLKEKAYEIGYPVLIKAIAGGGGRGMRRVDAHVDFDAALDSAAREAESAFGDSRVLIEKYISAPRHIEVQVFGDSHGGVVHLFERDCSLQRRHQKVIEESPAPGLPEATLSAMSEAAVAAARAVGYVGAGTVEFIVDSARGLGPDCFYFLEMNTRLQVEHPVTEATTGLDLVEWQLRVAAGEPLPLKQDEIRRSGWAIEARLNAEDPENGFLPSPGKILALRLEPAAGLRVDAGVEAGDAVTPFYDSMIAKLIAHAPTRAEALAKLRAALARAVVIGPKTNLAFLSALLSAREVEAGAFDTVFIDANASRLGAEPREADPRAILAGAEALIAAPASRQDRGPAHDPWNVADSFELTGPRRVGCEVRVEGHVERLVAIDDNGRRTLAFADGRALGADEAAPQTVLATGEAAFVLRGGRQIRVVRVDPLAGGLVGAGESSGEIAAPMHGRVIALYVEEGERVEEGARLAVVEAMKMEHALVAPRAGRVANLTARVGDTAEQGQRLMTIEAQEG
ncbi:MAG TPA: biotin carboxylase N-terminal domain-containing protein [Roseiarcus sp.]|nr:biotin carboxylase N-terminal domain-containing protein [Roseiarcus sp.]